VSTESTTGLEAVLRSRLLNFSPLGNGTTVAQEIGSTASGAGVDGTLYWDRAPDNIDQLMADQELPLRWGVLRLKNRRLGGDHGERDLMELEVMLYARPRSQKAAMEGIADRMDQAMLRYSDRTSGLVGTFPGRSRTTLPPFKEPADGDVVQIMLEYTLVVWPAYLTQYHDEPGE
jgi:hypothetical protein